jgi:hypothetical protein
MILSMSALLALPWQHVRSLAARLVPERVKPFLKLVERAHYVKRGVLHSGEAGSFPNLPLTSNTDRRHSQTDFACFFHGRTKGAGLNKWLHHLEIYERHLAPFRGKRLNLLEIGVQSGGSLDMWRYYFGNSCRVFGVDIDPRCKAFEHDGVRIFIGDQADREFWRHSRKQMPLLDVVIDDGGHTPEQQIASIEELLPHMAAGGVYICEDIYGYPNAFAAYMSGISLGLHEANFTTRAAPTGVTDVTSPNWLQQCVQSIHMYPYVTVLEVNASRVNRFVALKKGSDWLGAAAGGGSAWPRAATAARKTG